MPVIDPVICSVQVTALPNLRMASVTSGSNYSIDNQISFIVQWFRTWSELQKDDFVNIFAQKLSPGSVNGLVNGMQNVNVGYKRVSLFSCQVNFFMEEYLNFFLHMYITKMLISQCNEPTEPYYRF